MYSALYTNNFSYFLTTITTSMSCVPQEIPLVSKYLEANKDSLQKTLTVR